ncbi:MAG: MFS transporter [Deltaproteobacteria bacterium]|nr:MFS transporter [Deltaproteobacteria bacterium]MBW1951986.1 MFS transporter [Deltaproteobacteria bacterium]MBW1987229.1 MFS transporter [Deltaproteobacteria bacterium]MBW2134290.1 MFS transporter [Deltaproteobacteria bacterium]
MPLYLADTFVSFRHRNYRLFFFGQAISLIGTWMQSVAQSWLVLLLTNSAFLLGLVGALSTLPILLFSFWGGVVADHVNRRVMVIVTNTAALLLALLLGLLVYLKWVAIWHILLIVLGLGTVMAFDIPARQSFIVELVGKEDLPNAIALNSSLFNGTRVLGPAVAGLMIASVGMANCFFINALTYLAPVLGLMLMRLPISTVSRPRPRTWTGMLELTSHLRSRPDLTWMLVVMGIISVLVMPFLVLMPMIARDVLGTGARGYGFLMAATGLGAFLGALILANRLRRHSPMPFFWGGAVLLILSLISFSFCRNYMVALGWLFLAGLGMVINISTTNSLLQLNVPDELRGRIMSLFSLILIGLNPVGSLLFGTLADYWGPCLTVGLGSSTAGLACLVIFCCRPELRGLSFGKEAVGQQILG